MKSFPNDTLRVIGGVLSYRTAGRDGVFGQAIGASSDGRFCVIFVGSRDEAEEMARLHIRKLERDGHHEITAIFVPNDDMATYGNPMSAVFAPLNDEPSGTGDKYILTIPGAPHGLPCDIGVLAYYPAERSVGKLFDSCDFDFIADDKVRRWLENSISDRALDDISAMCCREVEKMEAER